MVDTAGGRKCPPPIPPFPTCHHSTPPSLLLLRMVWQGTQPPQLSWVNKRKGMRQVCLAAPAYPSSLGTLTGLPAYGAVFWGMGRETLYSIEAEKLSM